MLVAISRKPIIYSPAHQFVPLYTLYYLSNLPLDFGVWDALFAILTHTLILIPVTQQHQAYLHMAYIHINQAYTEWLSLYSWSLSLNLTLFNIIQAIYWAELHFIWLNMVIFGWVFDYHIQLLFYINEILLDIS